MTEQQHPITPPPELVQQWCDEWYRLKVRINTGIPEYVATQAARWGFRQCIKADAAWLENKLQKARDQELEACMEWMRSHFHGVPQWADELRAARRPKPQSLAGEALKDLAVLLDIVKRGGVFNPPDTIRLALERLQELEEGNE